jgi:hypothetical protein
MQRRFSLRFAPGSLHPQFKKLGFLARVIIKMQINQNDNGKEASSFVLLSLI